MKLQNETQGKFCMEKPEVHQSVSHTERCHRSLLGHTVLTKDSECAVLRKALFDYCVFPYSLHQGRRDHRLRGQGPKSAKIYKQNYKPKSETKTLRTHANQDEVEPKAAGVDG